MMKSRISRWVGYAFVVLLPFLPLDAQTYTITGSDLPVVSTDLNNFSAKLTGITHAIIQLDPTDTRNQLMWVLRQHASRYVDLP